MNPGAGRLYHVQYYTVFVASGRLDLEDADLNFF